MRSVEFHPEAQNEFASAARFYEDQMQGLGLDFTLTIQRTYERLLAFRASGARFGRQLRRVLVPKFPYGLLYRIEPDRLYIVAVINRLEQSGSTPAAQPAR